MPIIERSPTGCTVIELQDGERTNLSICETSNALRATVVTRLREGNRQAAFDAFHVLLSNWGCPPPSASTFENDIGEDDIEQSGLTVSDLAIAVTGICQSSTARREILLKGGRHYIFPIGRFSQASVRPLDGEWRIDTAHAGQALETSEEGSLEGRGLISIVSLCEQTRGDALRMTGIRQPDLEYLDQTNVQILFAPESQHGPSAYALHFPGHYSQRAHAHIHPHHRVGTVLRGRGILHVGRDGDESDLHLEEGRVFSLRTGVRHWFETFDKDLLLGVVHPITPNGGPTHHRHPVERGTFESLEDVMRHFKPSQTEAH